MIQSVSVSQNINMKKSELKQLIREAIQESHTSRIFGDPDIEKLVAEINAKLGEEYSRAITNILSELVFTAYKLGRESTTQ
jgi:flagellar basal body-associated protein FliL